MIKNKVSSIITQGALIIIAKGAAVFAFILTATVNPETLKYAA